MESTLREQTQGFPNEEKELRSPPSKRKYIDLKQYHQLADEVSMYISVINTCALVLVTSQEC